MTPRRKQRLMGVAVVVVGVAVAATFVVRALESNLTFFYSPELIAAGEVMPGQQIRLGGLVVNDSFVRQPGSMEARFVVTDNTGAEVIVSYTGVLPDLFQEGQGVVTEGKLDTDGLFVANEVLAKHDEEYMSPQVAKMLEEQGHPTDAASKSSIGSGTSILVQDQ